MDEQVDNTQKSNTQRLEAAGPEWLTFVAGISWISDVTAELDPFDFRGFMPSLCPLYIC